MRIWLITVGEPWPTDGKNPRLLRTGVMARMYARAGDTVVWFNGTFDHYQKTNRFEETVVRELEPGLTIVGLHAKPYLRNISFKRILHHRRLAKEFQRLAPALPMPDVIVASMPPLELSQAAVRYGKTCNVPVVVDIRDLWPDIFLEVLPKFARWAGRFVVCPFDRMLKESVRSAAAIIGVSERAVEWALERAHKSRQPSDGALPLAYAPDEVGLSALAEAAAFWDDAGIRAGDQALTICFFGSLTHRIELETVLAAAELIPSDMRGKVRFVICGVGELAGRVQACAVKTNFVVAPGWVNAPQISVLMQRSQIGLLPYPSSEDFIRIIPNKVFDYLSGGLPILTSLTGVTERLVTSNGCGWLYRNGDAAGLVAQLKHLHENPELIAQAASRSTNAAADYSASKVYGGFRDRLDTLIWTRKGGRSVAAQ